MKRYYDQLEQLAKGSERQEKENKKVESKDRPLDGFLAIFSDARQMHKYINSYPYDKISKYIPQLKARGYGSYNDGQGNKVPIADKDENYRRSAVLIEANKKHVNFTKQARDSQSNFDSIWNKYVVRNPKGNDAESLWHRRYLQSFLYSRGYYQNVPGKLSMCLECDAQIGGKAKMAKSELDKVITAKRAKEAERKANEEHFRSMPVIANPGSYAPAPESLKTDIALKTQGKSSVQNSIPVGNTRKKPPIESSGKQGNSVMYGQATIQPESFATQIDTPRLVYPKAQRDSQAVFDPFEGGSSNTIGNDIQFDFEEGDNIEIADLNAGNISPEVYDKMSINGKKIAVYYYMMNKYGGILTSNQILGIMGNMEKESGFDATIIEIKAKKGYGLCQRTGTRREALETYALAKDLRINSYQVQIDFLMHELTTIPDLGLNKLKSATTIAQATEIFLNNFEKPKNRNQPDRAKIAQGIARLVSGPEDKQLAAVNDFPLPARPNDYFVGDSLPKGYGTQVPASKKQLTQAGQPTDVVVAHALKFLPKNLHGKNFIISMATNDLENIELGGAMGDGQLNKVRENAKKLIDVIVSRGGIVKLCSIPPFADGKYTESIQKVNRAYESLVKGMSNIEFKDVYAYVVKQPNRKDLYDDNTHFTPQGYKQVAKYLYDIV